MPPQRFMDAELRAVLRETSRTFGLGILALGEPLTSWTGIAYLVLRVSDYLEDNQAMPGPVKVRLLGLWQRVLAGEASAQELVDQLEGDGDPIPDLAAVSQAREIAAALDGLDPDAKRIIAERAGATTLGMARWVERGPDFRDEADLDDYMHEVAGRVGYLKTGLFALHSPAIRRRLPELMPLAREYGLALQTVNVIRGLKGDRERGWVFVPRSFASGLKDTGELFDDGRQAEAAHALELLCKKAARHLRSAVRYMQLLPRRCLRIRIGCALPLLFAARTLALSWRNPLVWSSEVKMTRPEVRGIIRRTPFVAASNAAIARYAGELLGETV